MTGATAKHYLITGAGRGIGRGLSRLLLEKGHRVFLIDNNSIELTNTESHLKSQKHTWRKDFDLYKADLRQPAEIEGAVRAASRFFGGRLDVLVNNAAFTGGVGGPPLSRGPDFVGVWHASLETNLTGPMLVSQACLPLLAKAEGRATGGSIVHVSSTRAFMAEAGNEAYAATKAGLLGLTQAMAVSLAGQGVRVNAILPGWIHVGDECKGADEKGERWEEGLSEADHRWHLSGRVGRGEDGWRAVEYLAEAEFVTGTEMVVDGGVTRKMVYPE